MVDDLLRALSEFKANMEYRNVDFNADKNKQYEAVRNTIARKYSSGDVDLFGPEGTTAIPEDVEESQRKELVEKVKSEKALVKKGYSRVMEKIKELRQKVSNAVTMGSRSGSGKLVIEFYDVMLINEKEKEKGQEGEGKENWIGGKEKGTKEGGMEGKEEKRNEREEQGERREIWRDKKGSKKGEMNPHHVLKIAASEIRYKIIRPFCRTINHCYTVDPSPAV
ncbi:hypothetical protein AWC38_SpisGene15925 [Stylophora pistillata]|uniref:Uncharacterized protein n=1 Tax=Stylophora pistillata TaxID=50429 RepID=A0A2B4RMI7_STYPI|nr:hypothetical protein AWC38_SpisGene15925 [Stylophora pistillata]